jgi:hypothetical protein
MKLLPSDVPLSPQDHDLYEYSMSTNSKGYVFIGSRKLGERKVHKIVAQRMGLIANKQNGLQIDHINQNKFDNRRENLRLTSFDVNMNNCRPALTGRGFKIKKNKFFAKLKINGKDICLGTFETPEEARMAYVAAKNRRLTELGLTDLLLKE